MKLLEVIGKLFGVFGNLTDPKQYTIKEIKQMKRAIQAAEQYIFVNSGEGEYASLDGAKKFKYLTHYRKRFFNNN